ncbi:MAG TPA: hypothetical protein VJ572_07695 [Azonexus sp.]|nr:hypothetical protein [Azonexus sp.]
MEILAWGLYGLLLVGPYIVAFFGIYVAVFLLWKLSFRSKTKTGYAIAGAIFISASGLAYIYLVKGPSDFNAACASGTGVNIFKNVKANSYALTNPGNLDRGYTNTTDATLEQAILNVAYKKLQFVELLETSDAENLSRIHDSGKSHIDGLTPANYGKLSIAPRGSKQCRWLMPEDIAPLDYRTYISYGVNHKLNEALFVKAEGKECVAIESVSSISSSYLIEFYLSQQVADNLQKHEIRVVDLSANREVVGNMVAYEYVANNVYSSVAFWIGNGREHSRCPMNLLEGNGIHKILQIG